VHGDGDENETGGERDPRREASTQSAERRRERGHDQPREQRKADYSLLGSHRHRSRVRRRLLRVDSLEPGSLSVGFLEAADSDSDDRMMHRDPGPL
jgi:hypothetical protein